MPLEPVDALVVATEIPVTAELVLTVAVVLLLPITGVSEAPPEIE